MVVVVVCCNDDHCVSRTGVIVAVTGGVCKNVVLTGFRKLPDPCNATSRTCTPAWPLVAWILLCIVTPAKHKCILIN